MKQPLNEQFRRMQKLAGIQLNEGMSTDKFYAPDYVAQKYGDEAKEIEQNIGDEEENNPNIWDLYTSLETPEEVEDFIKGFKN
jgi:hypothetical protein